MNQNNDSNNGNGAEGNERNPRRTQNRGVDLATAFRGRYTFVTRDPLVTRDRQAVGVSNALQDVRSVPEDMEYTIVLAGNTRNCRGIYTNERIPLDLLWNEQNEDNEETAPANNGQENRESASVQTAEQETQENRESASVERSGRSDQENRESAPAQQGALMGGQPWSEQIPSQNQLKLRQRREKRDQRQPRRRRALQQRHARSRRPPFLVSFNDRKEYLDEETKRLQALHEANERVNEAESAYRASLQHFNRLARSNHRG